jgi:signal transduction histidine kinase
MPHAALLLDEDLRVVLANRAAAALFQSPLEQLCGVPISALVSQTTLPALLRNVGARPVTIETARSETALTLKMNAVRLALRLRHSGTGTRGFILLLIEDISEKATLEQQLVETEKQAAMGQLAAGILHEIANPLTGIGSNLLFVRGALSDQTPPAVRQALDASLQQVGEMRQLLGTLSGFPRRPALCYERSDLHEVLHTFLTFVAKDAERRRIELIAQFAPSRLECDLDVRMIKQVFLNLLKNAMEAMPYGGTIEVRTSYRAGDALRPPTAVVEVADSGLGIAEADLRKVFRPLFSTKARGAGLGLSFCRQTVEEHGGEIQVRSGGERQGTTVIVAIPVRQIETVRQ